MVPSAETMGASNKGFDTVDLHRPTQQLLQAPHVVAAQVEIESKSLKLKAIHPYYSFKRLVPGPFNVGFIGSTCTTTHRTVGPYDFDPISALI